MTDSTILGWTLCETALGGIGLAWSEKGLARLRLPERDSASTIARLHRDMPAGDQMPPPSEIAALCRRLKRYAAGDFDDFTDVAVDLGDADPFRIAIYAAARRFRHGQTTTYGALAAAAGHPGLARETGQALGSNPVAIVIPCHRVVAAGGKLGGFSAHGGASAKQRLLELEGFQPPVDPHGQAAFAF